LSMSPFILAMSRAGRPARACSISRRMRIAMASRISVGARIRELGVFELRRFRYGSPAHARV
jgi:hypothetical protein